MRIFYFLILVFLPFFSPAQNNASDWALIAKHAANSSAYPERQVKLMFIGKTPLMKYNPLSLTLSGLMYFYQKAISHQLSSNCPYETSCSEFSKKVISRYGIVKGIALSSDRLMRCTKLAIYDVGPDLINEEFKIFDDPEVYQISEEEFKKSRY